MTTVRDLHRQAMTIFDDAEMARRNGNTAEALTLYKEAQTLESQAAALCEKEPSKSILAASAYNIGIRVLEIMEKR